MKIYQTRDFHSSFDYEDGKVALDEYALVYENNKYDNGNYDLEDIFQYFNCWEDEDGRIEQTFRSLSVGDIVELNGKYHRCEPIGWKEMKLKVKTILVTEEK